MARSRTVPYLIVLAALLAGGVLCLAGSGMTWGVAQRADLVGTEVPVTGADLLPIGRAGGLLALAALVAVHATRRWGRRSVGLVLGVAGLAVVAQAYAILRDLPGEVLGHLEGLSASAGHTVVSSTWAGPAVTAAGAGLIAVAGLALAVAGPVWPSMGARYERPAPARPRTASGERAAWDALDRGEDPTI
jgi:uncharacterized membrane protein (TIGR02234 family)